VLVRGREAAVVDTGTAGSADQIGQSLTDAGSSWAAVKHVVLTHYHDDHAGGMRDVMQRAASAAGYVGLLDLPAVGSPRELHPASDGQEIFGLRVVGTPGHTAGHISLFDPGTGVLVAGDALTNTGGLDGSNPQYTSDEEQAKQSVKRLSELPVRAIFVGHGPPIDAGAAAALKTLAGSI
jgi:glyoxylase-like metal-dependent hydrolase (beta-lactamase superfamily II)